MTATESGPMFSRVVERGRTSSWKAAAPAVVVLVAFVILLAYLASKVTSYSQQLSNSQAQATQAQQQLDATQKRTAQLEKDNALARNPGRTTFLIENKAAKDSKSWAAATWGETTDGKSWLRVNGYGFAPAAEGKQYGLWFVPTKGDPVRAGRIEPGQDGSAFTLAENLPAVDQGKQVLITMDDENAKAPGDKILSADLPKLQPAQKAASDQAPATDEAPAK